MLRDLRDNANTAGMPDGVTPVFLEVGAAPTAGNAVYPPGSIARFGTTYYLQSGTLAAPVWTSLATLITPSVLAALSTGLLKVTTGTGALSTAVPGVDYALGSARDYWAAQAAAKLGLAPKNLFGRWVDFDDGSPLRVVSSGTTPSPGVPAVDGSWHSFTAGDDVNAGAFGFAATNHFSGLAPKHVANVRTSPWYLVGRWKTTTVPGATARSVIGLGTGGDFRAGIVKASNATKFCAVWTGAVLASTISFDTSTHEVVARNDGTNVYLSVDGEAEVSAAVGALSTSSAELFFEIAAGALEAKQTFQVDYIGLWTGRT